MDPHSFPRLLEKAYILKQRPFRKSTDCIQKRPPDRNALVTKARKDGIEASEVRVESKQRIGGAEFHTERPCLHAWITELLLKHQECILRKQSVRMQEHENISGRIPGANIKLHPASGRGSQHDRTSFPRYRNSSISTSTINHNDLRRSTCGVDALKTSAHGLRFI